MKLFFRTIGIQRARVKIGMGNIAYNMLRYVFHEGRRAASSLWLLQNEQAHHRIQLGITGESLPQASTCPDDHDAQWYFEVST